MWYTCTYNVQVSCVLFGSVVGMRVMRTWCRTSRQCVREIQHDVIMEATGESFRLRPADVLFFPSRLKHFGGADILRGIRAEELQSITEAETIAHRNGFWAIALHFYVYERSVPPASSTTLQAALKETKMCENLESIL